MLHSAVTIDWIGGSSHRRSSWDGCMMNESDRTSREGRDSALEIEVEGDEAW